MVGRIGELIRIRRLIWLSRLIWLPDLIALPDWFESQDWFDSPDLTRLTSWSGRVILMFWWWNSVGRASGVIYVGCARGVLEVGRINLDSQINTRFESNLWFDQLLTLHEHNQRKSLHWHDQQKFIIKTSKWLDPTKMLVESNLWSRINPRTWPHQDVSRVKSWESNQSSESNKSGRAIKSDSRINLDSWSIAWFKSTLQFDQPSSSHRNEVPTGEFRASGTISTYRTAST